MQLQFCGANHEVTGSCHRLITSKGSLLVDCGMFQGGEYAAEKNFQQFPFEPKDIDVLLVTHAHLDHVGRIPKLVKEGFKGTIYATKATLEMMEFVMKDAHQIMLYNHRKHKKPMLYSLADIEAAMQLTAGVDYDKYIDVGVGVKAIWHNAGHIYGSAFLEVDAEGKKIGFSGDIGNENVPILKDTSQLGGVDVLLCESTYGDRLHEPVDSREQIILDLITEGCRRGGTIMMPSFSIERTQELLYALHKLSTEEKALPNMPIYLDSPLAINVTKVYKKYPEYYDQEACKHYLHGEDFLSFPELITTYSRDESKKINEAGSPKLIIAGAGMMNGGRILHHAKRYLSDPNSTLIIIGYQAEGTIGRRLYEGVESINLFGEDIPVNCTIKAIGALSGHGDQKKLMNWVGGAEKKPGKMYMVHGEPHAATTLSHKMKEELGIPSYFPMFGDVVEL